MRSSSLNGAPGRRREAHRLRAGLDPRARTRPQAGGWDVRRGRRGGALERGARHQRSPRLGRPTISEQGLDADRVRVARRPQLAPRAVPRLLVLAPADQLRAVAEAVALHLVVAHLDHQLRPERRLLELARSPPVRLREPPVGCVDEQRQHAPRDVLPRPRRDGARADVVELAVLAIEPEQQRRDRARVALPPQPDDDAVRRLVLLHLDHPVARARQVRRRQMLRDDAVEPERLEPLEPPARIGDVAGRGREPEPSSASTRARRSASGSSPHLLAVPEQHVEDDELGRDLRRQPPDPRLRRMEPHLHRIEVERAVTRDHDLPVERRPRREQLAERPQLREVAQQRPLVARPQRQLAVDVLEHAAEAVPLRLVLPPVTGRQLAYELAPPSAGTGSRLPASKRSVGFRR